MALSDEDFDALVNRAVDALKVKQAALARDHGLAVATAADYAPDAGRLVLADAAGRPLAETQVIEIGAYSARHGAWRWAWADPNLPPVARAKAEALKSLAQATGVETFADPRALRVADEAAAWRLVALAVNHLDALGAHRQAMPDGSQMAFFAIMSLRDARGAGGYGWTYKA
ncbi:DUF6882 domain-containing protein [Caulobacter sp. KR2-114]|uniref:DUF6882 domain-containing protein n=1 Tax=Caulobacter sp. KR2-114 TaxID=3400912 RepID=UPI003C06BDE0